MGLVKSMMKTLLGLVLILQWLWPSPLVQVPAQALVPAALALVPVPAQALVPGLDLVLGLDLAPAALEAPTLAPEALEAPTLALEALEAPTLAPEALEAPTLAPVALVPGLDLDQAPILDQLPILDQALIIAIMIFQGPLAIMDFLVALIQAPPRHVRSKLKQHKF